MSHALLSLFSAVELRWRGKAPSQVACIGIGMIIKQKDMQNLRFCAVLAPCQAIQLASEIGDN